MEFIQNMLGAKLRVLEEYEIYKCWLLIVINNCYGIIDCQARKDNQEKKAAHIHPGISFL